MYELYLDIFTLITNRAFQADWKFIDIQNIFVILLLWQGREQDKPDSQTDKVRYKEEIELKVLASLSDWPDAFPFYIKFI